MGKNTRNGDQEKKLKIKGMAKGKIERNKILLKKTPFVVGVVRHNVGSPYKLYDGPASIKTAMSKRLGTTSKQKTSQGRERLFQELPCTVTTASNIKVVHTPSKKAKGDIANSVVQIESNVQTLHMSSTLFAAQLKKQESKDPKEYDEMLKKRCDETLKPTVNNAIMLVHPNEKTANTAGARDGFVTMEKLQAKSESINATNYMEDLNKEIAGLESLCDEWAILTEENEIPEEVVELINVAVGQTKLLIKQKLAQYRGLIDDYSAKRGPIKVTEDDLRGFWEMVSIQVDNVRSKFAKLAVLKQNGWQEPEQENERPCAVKKCNKKVPIIIKAAMKSSIRDHIARARKMKKTIEQ